MGGRGLSVVYVCGVCVCACVCVCVREGRGGGGGGGGWWRVGQNLLWEQLMNRRRGDKLLVMKGKGVCGQYFLWWRGSSVNGNHSSLQ